MQNINPNPFDNYLSSGLERFDSQMHFIIEIDKMTGIIRQTLLTDGSRQENDAEHSWKLAVMAQLLSEYCVHKVNVERVIKMVTVHDLIEIYAGDTYAYDTEGNKTKEERERKAADKLYALLPQDQSREIRSLWEEFDRRQTPDAIYAGCLDSIQPFLHNTLTNGASWKKHNTKKSAVLGRIGIVEKNMPMLWPWVQSNLQRAVTNGWLQNA